ncbi:hypothetical protein D2T29_12815 [Sinirhodobacter populi]|uniref:Uncharacterized protein n=1 Tax=Paenirhodobacter populi TaxID=2306993 RepID=A0A443KCK8_9RHOB|nr:hypothetical protein [Sinirhodobacter populi]RWR30547.1 hypothetical protein D2T29_12815 [Sinirhodobacter populi]
MVNMEGTIGAAFGMLGCVIAVAGFYLGQTKDHPQPAILLYDRADIAAQAKPFVEAGQDPIAVFDAAVSTAADQGFIVIDKALGVAGPASASLKLVDFVAVGGSVGKAAADPASIEQMISQRTVLPGTVPAKPSRPQSISEEAEIVRQFMSNRNGAPAPTPAQEE